MIQITFTSINETVVPHRPVRQTKYSNNPKNLKFISKNVALQHFTD